MTQEAPEHLLLIPKEQAQVYCPGRHLTCTKDPSDLTVGYSADDINITRLDNMPARDAEGRPRLPTTMALIWELRYMKAFPDGVKRNGQMPGMRLPKSTEGTLAFDIFDSSYLDYRLTIPKGDEYDAMLERDQMLTYVNIHHVPITADGKMLHVARGSGRDSWDGTILCTHSWGDDNDKNYAHEQIMTDLAEGQGVALFRQARDGVRREINPRQASGNPDVPDKVLEEVLAEDDVEILSANCITNHALPGDFGYHIGFTAAVKKEAGDILEAVKKYPIPEGSRMSALFATDFTEESMIKFFRDNYQRIATSVEPAIIMACVQKFGEGFLKELPFDTIVQKRYHF